eukprot:2218015-Pleurochrysis_carterae.AAC.1
MHLAHASVRPRVLLCACSCVRVSPHVTPVRVVSSVAGYKLDLRLYVLIASACPFRVYLYQDALIRFATHKYNLDDLDNTFSHLTNSSINKNSNSYGVEKERIGAGCKWSFLSWAKRHPNHPLTHPMLWLRIRVILNLTLLSIAAGIPENDGGCFELLGFDVIVDETLKPWLLEVNCSPALGVECEADETVRARALALSLALVPSLPPSPSHTH